MDALKMIQANAAIQVQEKTTLTAGADTAGSLAGKWIKTVNADGKNVYYSLTVAGSDAGKNIVNGIREESTMTTVADSAGSLAGKYCTAFNPVTNFYAWFTVNEPTNQEIINALLPHGASLHYTKITTVADVGGNLGGTYFVTRDSADTAGYVWYDTGASVDPAPGGTGIKVSISSGDSIATINAKTAAAMNAAGKWLASIYGTVLHIAILTDGAFTAWTAGTSGFTMADITAVMPWKSFDPAKGNREVSGITLPADTAGNFDGTYFLFYTGGDAIKYKVWYSKDANTTEPVVASSTGIKVSYTVGATAAQMVAATALAIQDAGAAQVFAYGAKFTLVNITGGTATDTVNGTVPTGFAVSKLQDGAAAASLTGYVGVPVSINKGDANTAVATALGAALNLAYCPTCKAYAFTATVGTNVVTFIRNQFGVTTDAGAGTSGFTPATTVQGAAPDTTGLFYQTDVPSGETAANVGAAVRALINANTKYTGQIATGSTTSIVIDNRKGGIAGTATTTNTGWTNVRTQTGTTTLAEDAGNSASTNVSFKYFPPTGTRFFLNSMGITIGTGATTAAGVDMTKFGAITALTNGVIFRVCKADGTAKSTFMTIKSNYDLMNLSTSYTVLTGAAMGAISMYNDIKRDYGDELEVDGPAGEYIEFYVQDATTGSGRINFTVAGRVKTANIPSFQ